VAKMSGLNGAEINGVAAAGYGRKHVAVAIMSMSPMTVWHRRGCLAIMAYLREAVSISASILAWARLCQKWRGLHGSASCGSDDCVMWRLLGWHSAYGWRRG